MSEFLDKLKKTFECTPQPMGFTSDKCAPETPRMQVVLSLKPEDLAESGGYIKSADAVILTVTKASEANALEKMCQQAEGIPCGVWIKNANAEIAKKVTRSSSEFAAFPAVGTPLNILPGNDDKIAFVLEIEPTLSEGLLRTINYLAVEAVIVSQKPGDDALTWYQLMCYQRIANAVEKPLMVCVPSHLTADQLQALLDTGVSGLIIEAEGEKTAERIAQIVKESSKLTMSEEHKKGKIKAILPRLSGGVEQVEEEGGEEEDE
jgi:hypothetical protein